MSTYYKKRKYYIFCEYTRTIYATRILHMLQNNYDKYLLTTL